MDVVTPQPFRGAHGLPALLDAIGAGIGLDPAHAESLPPASYVSAELFELEKDRIFRSDWVAVGPVAQAAKVGDYFTVEVLGELLVVVRGEDRIRVMSRVCLHRWAPVAEGAGNTRMFSCPFHRWGYGLDGQLLTAPLMHEAAGFDPKACRLPEFRSEVVFGTVFVNLDGTADPLAERLADAGPVFDRYRMDDLVVAFGYERVCDFNWKIAVETFIECYHHIGAHARTAEPRNPGRLSYGIEPHRGWTACYAPLRPELPLSEKLNSGLPLFEGLTEDWIRQGGLYVIFPAALLTTNGDRIHWTTVLPLSADKCLWVRRVLVRPEALALPEFDSIVSRLQASSLVIFDEDVAVNDMQQVGAASIGARVGRLSHLELPVQQFNDYVRGRLCPA